ncbi:MAG: dTDP-glucose 4,6-dehydratase [Alphaproteobacteria bacterium]|nr:dTDP-glucose 4,6-dehydratase [Alphaproteobacteria bacterium]
MRTPRSLLVTGAAGFLGSTFVHRLQAQRPTVRVVSLDALTYAGDLANLEGLPVPGHHTFVRADIRDTAEVIRVMEAHAVDTVVHFAAESHVDRSIEGPAAFLSTNVEGTASMLEAARTVWAARAPEVVPRFHHISTDEVYGDLDGDQPAAVEGDRYAPSSPYAASKAAADHLVHAWRRTWGLPVSLTHASNSYGPRQYPEKLIPVVIGKALAGQPIPIYGDGRQQREWLHAEDHADGVLAVIERGAEGSVWHVGGPDTLENRELAGHLCALLDEAHPEGAPHARLMTSVPDRLGHDRRYALDCTKIRRELGWSPRWTLEAGLEQTVRWYVQRRG